MIASPALASELNFAGVTKDAASSQTFTTTDGKLTATVTGWSTPGSAMTTPTQGQVGSFSGYGLYVPNGVDADFQSGGVNYDYHYIDNYKSYDFVAITFASKVTLSNVQITAFKAGGYTYDSDFWVAGTDATNWVGITGTSFNATPPTISGSDGYGSYSMAVNSAGLSAKTWLIGAARSGDTTLDFFKLKGITVAAAVPEPATWMTMILGFGAIGGALRRRRQSALATA